MKKTNKILSVFLALLMVFSIIPMTSVEADAASVTLAQLQSKYPHGKYWNGGNANSYTSTPCNHHGSCSYSGSCGCNSFKGHAIQCMGFAYQLAYLVYGGDPYVDWTANRNSSALNSLKPGDVVRYKNDGHSIFVTGVSGDTVTYADCNSDGHCKIRWNQTISKSTLKSTFTYVDPAPYAWNSPVETHKVDSNYGKEFTAYPKIKITAENIFDANHNQISSSAWIGTSDKCTIHEVYTDGCCKVSYPLDDGGTKTVYSKISLFTHTHSYTEYYEAAHPHKVYKKCSCGEWYYTGAIKILSSCSSCKAPTGYHLWFDGGTKYYLHDTITVNAESNNAKEYKFVFTFPSGQEGSTDWMTSGKYSVYASEAGTYKVSYLAKNDYGTYDARKDGCTLTFYYVTPTISISNNTSVSLKVGNTHQIQLTTDTGSDTDITYSSSNTSVAIVSSSGLVTAKSSGTSTITAKLVYHGDNGDYTTSCKMTVSVSDKTYTVRFNANGGSGTMNNQSFVYGTSKALTANAFTRIGYTFLGWSTSSTATSATYTDKQSVQNLTSTDGGIVTLYAVWKPNTYSVKYNANGGTGTMSNSSHTYDVSKSLTANNFKRDGYTFLGWSTSSTATSATYTDKQSVKNLTSTNGGIVTLYAVWKLDSSSLTANSTYNATISTGGEMKYYTFTPSTSGKYVIYSTSSEDTRVYLYNSSGTQIDSNDDGGEGNNFRLECDLTAGTTYRFGVRYYNSSKTGTIPFAFGKVYTISYNANGGIGAPSSQSKDYGATLTLSSTKPTRTGYTFLGWSTSSTATTATYSAGGSFTTNANTPLYAVWKANTYTVKYNANCGTGTMSISSHTYDVSKSLTANNFKRDGYTFLGWSSSSTATTPTYTDKQSVKNLTSTNGGTVNLYAVWQKNPATSYTLSYNANGGTGAPSSQTGSTTYTISNTTPDQTGYVFLGWSKDSNASSASYQPGDRITISSNTTLYAVWKTDTSTLVANSTYNATISSGGEMKYYTFTPSTTGKYVIYSTSTEDTRVYLYNSSGTELEYNDDGGEGRNFRLEYELTAGTTYRYGIEYWSSSKTGTIPFTFGRVYTVSYNANNGIGAPSSQSKDYGTTLVLSSTVPTRTGYTFLGWSTSSTATTATYSAGGNFTSNSNTTLYAVWRANGTSDPENSYGFEIKQPSRTTIRHKDGIKLHANVENAPTGSYVVWTASNGKFKTEEINGGNSMKIVSDSNGKTTFTATLYNSYGEVLAVDSIEMKSQAGFFDKIGSFFRSLFGGTKIYEN